MVPRKQNQRAKKPFMIGSWQNFATGGTIPIVNSLSARPQGSIPARERGTATIRCGIDLPERLQSFALPRLGIVPILWLERGSPVASLLDRRTRRYSRRSAVPTLPPEVPSWSDQT